MKLSDIVFRNHETDAWVPTFSTTQQSFDDYNKIRNSNTQLFSIVPAYNDFVLLQHAKSQRWVLNLNRLV